MFILKSVFYFLAALVVLVGFHELGHFLAARLCGVRVLRFSLGFGRVLFSRTGKDGCEYALSLIPLGGYVKMLDLREGEVPPEEMDQEFSSRSVWKRLFIVAAGPLFNIILAFFLYWGMFVMGVAAVQPYVTGIHAGSAAWQAGLRNDDLLLRVGDYPVLDWEDGIYEFIQQVGSGSLELEVRRQDGSQGLVTLDLSGWSIHRDQGADIFRPLGFSPKYHNLTRRIAAVQEGSPAEKAGIRPGDQVAAADGVPLDSWFDFSHVVEEHPGREFTLTVSRPAAPEGGELPEDPRELDRLPQEQVVLKVTPESVPEAGGGSRGRLGVAVAALPLDEGVRFVRKYGPVEAVGKSLEKMAAVTRLTVVTLWKLITGDIAADNISGPIAIAKSAGVTASIGLEYFLGFMALISINLGIMNLFPLPVLDGGHIAFYVLEALAGRPLPDRVMQGLMYFGIFVLLLIMTLAVYNDIVFDGF